MNYRIYQQIIDRLFDEEDMKTLFLKKFNDLRDNPNLPPVPESIQYQDFPDKLHYLFEETTDEKLIQVVLAPCLREKVYQYLASKDSPYQQSYSFLKGEEFLSFSNEKQRHRAGFSVQDVFIETFGQPAWEQVREFPLAEASLELLKQIKPKVAITAGNQAWKRYLAHHRNNQAFATDIQLIVLGEIFDSSIDVTIITNNIIKETVTLRDAGENNHHFYCEDNNHWYVHANGYMKTIPDGNCGYNGFAQWFKFLVLDTKPDQLPARADSLEFTPHRSSPPTLFSPVMNSEPNSGNEISRVSPLARASQPETMNWFLIGLSFVGLIMLITSILLLLSMLVLALSTSFAQLGLILIHSGFETIAYQLVGAVGLNVSTAAVLAASITFGLTAGLGGTLFYDFTPATRLNVTEPRLDNTRMSL